jgi:MoaA/NifB/PqqE/SkfB family radical SAM enzyme
MKIKTLKVLNLMRAWWMNAFRFTTPFVRFIPTDRCNLDCRYCFQHDNRNPREMTREEFDAYLDHAVRLKVGLISFLGGEPLTWPHIYHAVDRCTKRRIFTDMTTNGTLLNGDSILKLGRAGLDALNISVDVSESSKVSAKNSIFKPEVLDPLLVARKKHGMNVRVNAVLYKDNTREVRELIEYTHDHGIPISIGFIVPHLDEDTSQEINFTLDDHKLLDDITAHIIERKTSGYKIIDTRQYFRNIHRYLRGEKFWDCNYQKRFGWLNVTPAGRIRSCTKKMDELDDRFLDLTPKRVAELRKLFQEKIEECNVTCYSNCAYNGYYFFRNLPLIAFKYVTGLSRNH